MKDRTVLDHAQLRRVERAIDALDGQAHGDQTRLRSRLMGLQAELMMLQDELPLCCDTDLPAAA